MVLYFYYQDVSVRTKEDSIIGFRIGRADINTDID